MSRATRLPMPPGLPERAGAHTTRSHRIGRMLERYHAEPDAADAALDLQVQFAVVDPEGLQALMERASSADRQTAVARLMRAVAASRRSRLDEALALLPVVALEARIDTDERLLAWTLSEWARASAMKGDRLRAFEGLRESLLLSRTLGWVEHEAVTLCHLGLLYGQDAKSEPYAAHTREALALYRQLDDAQGVAQCLCNLGGALTTLGAFDEATRCYTEALTTAHAFGWAYLEALGLAGRGGLCFQEGHIDGGLADYSAAAGLLESLGQHFQLTRHDLLVSGHLLRGGRGTDALAWARSALGRADTYGFEELRANAYDLIARGLSQLGRHEEAAASLRKLCDLREQRLDLRVADAQRATEQAHLELLTRKEAQWERERLAVLEEKNAALAAALGVQDQLRQELERASRTDPLTGLANRREMDRYLGLVVLQARRTWRPLSFVLIDVDHFKDVNDRYGHAAGDAVLVELARRFTQRMRATDFVARWGGEEFCIILPDTELDGACVVAEELRRLVAAEPFSFERERVAVTISLGVAALDPDGCDPDRVLQAADGALYAAKRAGRNRVCRAPSAPRPDARAG